MHIRRVLIFIALIATVLFAVSAFAAGAESVPRMSTDELKSRLGEPGLVVLDSRSGRDWDSSAAKILGAVRGDPANVEHWAGNYDRGKTLVVYCA
jgi:rhodanese-related sulfurtransferase